MTTTDSSITPEQFVRDGWAPYSTEIRDQMRDLRDKLANLGDDPDPTQVSRYLKGIGKLIAQGETERDAARDRLHRAGTYTESGSPLPEPTRVASLNPFGGNEVRDKALRLIDQSRIDARAGDRLQAVVRAEPNPNHARYINAVADPNYASAWSKVMSDPDRAAIEMTDKERYAMIEAREATLQRDMATSPGADGGYALPFLLDPSLILTNDGSSNPLRQLATVRSITQKHLHVVTTDGVSASYGAEGTTVGTAMPELAQPQITAERATAFVRVSYELFADWSGINSEMAKLFQDARDQLEAEMFVLGTAVNEPEGIYHALDAGTAFGTALSAPSHLYAVQEDLGPRWQANAVWLANLSTLNDISQYVATADASNAPIFDAQGNLLRKRPYEVSYMPDDTLIYGDVRAGFTIVDRLGMSVELVRHNLDPSSGVPDGTRGLLAIWRSGSKVVVPSALRLIDAS